MDVTDFFDWPAVGTAIVMCDDFTVLGEALGGMPTAGAEAVVVRNGGPPGEAAVARFAATLLAGAREAQNTRGSAGRMR
jgi:hypothetical protein